MLAQHKAATLNDRTPDQAVCQGGGDQVPDILATGRFTKYCDVRGIAAERGNRLVDIR